MASSASIVLAESSNCRSWNWILARTKRSSALAGQHCTAAAATVSASAYRRFSSKKSASASRGAKRRGSAATASRSRFSALTRSPGALTISGAVWASRYRASWRKQVASASRGAARSGDSATDLCRRSSSSAHCSNDRLPPAARRSSSNKEISADRGVVACGAKALALRNTSFACRGRLSFKQIRAVVSKRSGRGGTMATNAAQAMSIAVLASARQGWRTIRAAPNDTMQPPSKCSSPSARSLVQPFENMTATLLYPIDGGYNGA